MVETGVRGKNGRGGSEDRRGRYTQMNVPGKNTNPRTEIVFIAAESVAVFVLICTAERESYCATRLKAYSYPNQLFLT
jgi:hypothetical protein